MVTLIVMRDSLPGHLINHLFVRYFLRYCNVTDDTTSLMARSSDNELS